MKRYGILIFAVLQLSFVYAQNQYGRIPYKYNAFINNAGISWACETYNTWSFADQPNSQLPAIHEYLVNSQKNGKIKSWLNTDFDTSEINTWKKGVVNDYYVQVDKKYNEQRLKNFQDATDLIEFHEIFYWMNHQLRSFVVSAAPQLKVVSSSGIDIGNTITSFASIHSYSQAQQQKKDKVVFLGSTEKTFNFDSLEAGFSLKKNYGMTLSRMMWYELSKGFNKVTDIKRDSTIASKLVMNYPAFDSTVAYSNDDTTTLLMIPGVPAYNYFSHITLLQDWYYNKTKDIFFNRINKAYLHITYYDPKELIYKNEKRFVVSFQ